MERDADFMREGIDKEEGSEVSDEEYILYRNHMAEIARQQLKQKKAT